MFLTKPARVFHLANFQVPKEILDMEKELETLNVDKEKSVKAQDFEKSRLDTGPGTETSSET